MRQNGFWYTYAYASVNSTPVSTPNVDTVSGPSYIVDSTTGANGTYYSARVTGWYNVNGGSATVVYPPTGTTNAVTTVYGGFALATEIGNATYATSGYRDFTTPNYLTQVVFYVKTNQAAGTSQTLRLNFL